MYGKIFTQIYDGSLYGRWQALVTFQQMIVLADQDGIVDMMPEALAARTSIPLDIIQQGISELEQPDRRSRTPDEEGRRITRLNDGRDWGWQITNYAHYRAIRTAEERREYFREHKRKQRAAARAGMPVNPSPPLSTKSPQFPPIVEVEVEADVELRRSDDSARGKIAESIETALIAQYGKEWESVAALLDTRSAKSRSAWVKEIATLTVTYGPETVARACNDALAAPDPLRMPSGLRSGCAGIKEFGVRQSATRTIRDERAELKEWARQEDEKRARKANG